MKVVKEINLELTVRCNLNCAMCPRSELKQKNLDLNWRTLEAMVADLARHYGHEPLKFGFAGYGEPLLHARLDAAIRLIKQSLPLASVTVTTNGHLLDEPLQDRILHAGLDYLRFSLNATCPEEYRRLMGSDRFPKIEANIERFIREKNRRKSPVKVGIQILDTRLNKENYPAYKKKWEAVFTGFDFITYRMMENRGGTIDSGSVSQGASPQRMQNRYPCYALWKDIAVDAAGNVYACCEAFTFRDRPTALRLGNLAQTPLSGLLECAHLRDLQKMHLDNDYAKLPECEICNKPLNYPNLWECREGRWEEKIEASSGGA